MAAGSGHAAEYLRRDELRVVHDLTCDLASGQVGQGRRDIVEGECLARGERRGGSVKAAILARMIAGASARSAWVVQATGPSRGTAMVAVSGTEPR